MPAGNYNTLANQGQASANMSATNTLETQRGQVLRTYTDQYGNVTSADIRVYGQKNVLVNVPNATGTKLNAGAVVTINSVRGKGQSSQIIGFGSAGSSAASAGAATASSQSNTVPPSPPANDGIPYLLWEQDPTGSTPDGLVANPGVNIYFKDTLPQSTSGGTLNGSREFYMRRLALTALPPIASVLDGLLVDLVDSYGNGLGMYRADEGLGEWVREDVGLVRSIGAGLVLTDGELSATGGGGGGGGAGNLLFALNSPATLSASTTSSQTFTFTPTSGNIVPANTLAVGDVLTFDLYGTYESSLISPPTFAPLFSYAGAVALTGPAIGIGTGVSSGLLFTAKASGTVISIGATGTIQFDGYVTLETGTSGVPTIFSLGASLTTVDTTSNATVDFGGTYSGVSSGNAVIANQIIGSLLGTASAGGSLIVTDGTTTVNTATSVDFTSGAVVTNLGSGVAGVAITGGGSSPYTVPLLSNFTVANSPAGSTQMDTATGLQLAMPLSGLFPLNVLLDNTAPGGTFTLTMGANYVQNGNSGIYVYAIDGSGKIVIAGFDPAGAKACNINYLSNYTTFISNPVSTDYVQQLTFMQWVYDGTNFIFYSGTDLNAMRQWDSRSATAFIGTPVGVGICQQGYQSSTAAVIFHYLHTA